MMSHPREAPVINPVSLMSDPRAGTVTNPISLMDAGLTANTGKRSKSPITPRVRDC